MNKKEKENKIVDMRDKIDELIGLLRTDRTLLSVCKCLIVGEAIWLDEEENVQSLFHFIFQLFSQHLQELCQAWQELDTML